MKTFPRVAIIASLCATMMVTVSDSSWAMLYKFTFTAQDLMEYTKVPSSADNTDTPVDAGIRDGARRITLADGTTVSSWLDSTDDTFQDMVNTSGYALSMFNFWGYGGSAAQAWGETYTVTTWTDTGIASTDPEWISFTYSDSDTLGKTVLAYARTKSGDAIALNATTGPTFTFTVNLSDDTEWLLGKKGQLVFWFGGALVANATDYTADYVGQLQGNMILTGVAVPEPATMILFGTGMAALALGGRRRSTFS